MSDRTRIIFGPPGTGKTTYLIEQVAAYLEDGVPPERIGSNDYLARAAPSRGIRGEEAC